MAIPELRTNFSAWIKLAGLTRRPLTNFGDLLSPLVMEAATGRKVVWAPPERADIVGVGSILELYASRGSGAFIWGSGLRSLPSSSSDISGSFGNILAVRGPNTRAALGIPIGTPLGDPGLLAPHFAHRSKALQRRPLVIPHFRTWASRGSRGLLSDLKINGFDVAPPSLEPRVMIDRINNASVVVTSSLHGVIVAHALGIPAQLVTTSTQQMAEPEFKYSDYASSMGTTLVAMPIRSLLNEGETRKVTEKLEPNVPGLRLAAEALAEGLVRSISVLT